MGKRSSIQSEKDEIQKKADLSSSNLLKGLTENRFHMLEESLKKITKSSNPIKLIHALYESSTQEGPSEEIKLNMIYFYLYFKFFLICKLSFSLHSHSLGHMREVNMKIHVFSCIILLFLLFCSIFAIFKRKAVRLRSRTLFFSLALALNFYFILGDERILSKITGESDSYRGMPMSIGLVSSIMLVRMVLFDSFQHIFIIAVTNSVVFITCHLSLHEYESFGTFAEAALILLFNILQICECYRADSRIKSIFLRREQQSSENSNFSLKNKRASGINTEAENVMNKCDLISKNLKNISTVVIYKDVKKLIKKSLIDLEKIKRKIAHSGFEATKIELSSDIQEEDKRFLNENFMENSIRKSAVKPVLSSELSEKLISSLRVFRQVQYESELIGFGQSWNFDILDYSTSTKSSFSYLGQAALRCWDLFEVFSLPARESENFLQELEKLYKPNPFHNSLHACDVLHSLFFLIIHSELLNYLLPLDFLALTIAALAHDVGHPGLSNSHLVRTRHALANEYNDLHVLQNMHCALTFKVMSQPGCDFLKGLSSEGRFENRKLVIELILSTDLSKHFEFFTKLKTRASLAIDLNFNSNEDKCFIMSMALKCADLAFCAKRREVFLKWSKRIAEEFFLQGDKEKDLKIQVSMFCDREKTKVLQVGSVFMNSVARPFLEVWSPFFCSESEKREVLECLRINLEEDEKMRIEENY